MTNLWPGSLGGNGGGVAVRAERSHGIGLVVVPAVTRDSGSVAKGTVIAVVCLR